MTKDKLSIKQLMAVDAVLIAPTIVEAAQVVGVSERTLRSWYVLPLFQQELRIARKILRNANIKYIQSLEKKAIQTLHEILIDPDTSTREKRLVAEDILKLSAHSYEITEIESDIDRLGKVILYDDQNKASKNKGISLQESNEGNGLCDL